MRQSDRRSRISMLPFALVAAAIPLALASQGCSAASDQATSEQSGALGNWRPIRAMPVRGPNETSPRVNATSAHLSYYGGRVLSNVKVYAVNWGPNVNSTVKSGIGGFYSTITNSTYFDWLSEYDTNITAVGGQQGTNQIIGRGTYAGQYTITPSTSSSSISDSTIQSELSKQLTAGHLPAPDANTIYMIDFPPGVSITQGGSSSCVAGGFCAYHGTLVYNNQHVAYGVMPDMSPGSGCDTGCGSNANMFDNSTSVHSHELIEAVTDADVGLATSNAPPLAWYDQTNGEIGDICNAEQATVSGYVVQKEWSNVQGACVVSGTAASNDFSITPSASSLSVADGSSGTDTIKTAVTSGSAETVSLTVSGAPSGVTATLSPTSVSSGGSSTLTVSASSSAAAGTYTLTVTGSATSGSHSAAITLTISGGGGGGGGALANGNFETGSLSGWSVSGSATAQTSAAHAGSWGAQVGSTSPTTDSAIAQTFTAPSGGGTLSFYYKVICPDTIQYDWATATLKDNTAGTTTTVLAKTCSNTGTWSQASAALTGGHSYTLTLSNHDDNYAGDATYTDYDDVTIGASSPPPPAGIANGGFESGDFTGWTKSGASDTVTTGAHHSGTYGAMLGSTSPTNGDSSVSQKFTAPAGTSKVTFWYGNTCPDTVTYDWATATLKDNTSGTTTTVLAKTCAASSTWTQLSAAITAGHSYTITLTSHDDNYSGDATYTYYDDVATQ